MPLINRLSSGRIFSDDFNATTLNPIWQTSLTDPTRYSVNDERKGHLRLKHGDVPFYLLMDMPNKDFVFEIKNDYFPVTEDDNAGIVVYQDNETHIDLLEYFNPDIGTVNYSHMRISKKGDIYTGYGSHNNGATWEIIGSGVAVDMPKIGLAIYNPPTANTVEFDVDYVKIFGDNKFVVTNLVPGMKVELLDGNGLVVRDAVCFTGTDHAYISLETLAVPYTGTLRVTSSDGKTNEISALTEIWGGDVFWYGLTLEIYRDETLLRSDEDTRLGHMFNGLIEESFIVKNPGMEAIQGVVVSKASYFDYPGAEWVQISEDNGLGQPLSYQESLALGTMEAGERRKIWVRVKKEMNVNIPLIGDRKFLLEITH